MIVHLSFWQIHIFCKPLGNLLPNFLLVLHNIRSLHLTSMAPKQVIRLGICFLSSI